VYKSIGRSVHTDGMGSFIGGDQPIYMSDLVVVLKGQIARVIKNRDGGEGNYILYNTKQSVEI